MELTKDDLDHINPKCSKLVAQCTLAEPISIAITKITEFKNQEPGRKIKHERRSEIKKKLYCMCKSSHCFPTRSKVQLLVSKTLV